ncbi:AsmA-like C-terminal region-containing protein [Methylocystis borbori]|uniref:AsmA-like C-terminal region-containing protein n=1 Tax=Methylocystis borbori TaxID=3118750 RepID=UPI002F96696C
MTHRTGRENLRGQGVKPLPRRPSAQPRRTSGRLLTPSRGAARLLIGGALGAALLVILTIGGFFYLLSKGPITFAWLAPRIAQSLDELAGEHYQISLRTASLANGEHGPTLSVDDLVVKQDGRPILAAPRAEVSLDFHSLLIGQLKPRRLEVLDLDLRLSVTPDGAVAISAGAEPVAATPPRPALADASQTPDIGVGGERVALLREAAGALRGVMDLATSPESPIGALDRFGVAHGRLVIDDRTIDRVLRYDDVTLSLDKGGGGMRFSAAAKGPSRRWTATAVAKGAPGGRRDFQAQLRDLSVDEIALLGGFRAARFDTDAPLAFDLSFALGAGDEVLEAVGGMEIGRGYFRFDEPDHEPVMIEKIAAAAIWDKAGRRVAIAPFLFKAGGFDMAIVGEARAPAARAGQAAGADEPWTIALRLKEPTVVAPERAGEKNIRIDSGLLNARFFRDERRIVYDKFAFSGPEAKIDLNGAFSWRNENHVTFALDVEETQIYALARLWPTHVAPQVRAWFVDHVPAGVVRQARYTADFDNAALVTMRYEQSPPDSSLLLEGEIVGGTVAEILPGMAPLTGVNGRLRVTGRTAMFAASSGVMETSPGRRLNLLEGRFTVADSALRPTPAAVEINVGGAVEAVGDLLLIRDIAQHATIPVEPGTLKGTIEGRLRVDFETGDDARDENTTFAIDATTSNLVIEKLIGKEKLEAGALHVVADRAGLRVNGTGRIYGAPATLDVHRAFGDKGAAQAQLSLTFDEAARQRAGYVISGLNGPLTATVRTPLPIEEVNTQIELDLTRTGFDNPLPGLTKPAGKPAKASFVLTRRGEGMALEQINFDAGSAQAQGMVEFSRDGAFRVARFSQVRLSPGDDMRVEVQRGGEAVKVVARGANFDARPLMQSLLRADRNDRAGGPSIENLDFDFKSPIVTGHGKQILSNVDFKMERRGGKPRVLELSGFFGREQLTISMARNQNAGQQLEVATNDGGSFLAFLDLYRKMDSGALSATVQLGQNRADGALRIRDFYVRGEPTLRRLMAQGGAARADARGNYSFDPELVRVGRLESDFTWSGGQLAVREGVLSGPEIGLTFDGYIDFPREQLDLVGSYVPAYALNSLLSNIPVLGVVLAGGQHEGVFALSYHVAGALNSPTVSVNPLSAIAPGLMRKIMGVIDGTARMPQERQR